MFAGADGWQPHRQFEPIIQKMWEPLPLTNLRASTACYRDSFTFLSFIYVLIIAWLLIYINAKIWTKLFKNYDIAWGAVLCACLNISCY
jgi:hypothetical protein